ncbi:MAG TPA: GNAT family N-acetyltransferase [Polyangiaceae bacterium]|nr:GNAT family N-acetyltransferase [Polyangiaceae bacterium]
MQVPSYQIRPARFEDLESLVALEALNHQLHSDHHPELYTSGPDAFQETERIRAQLSNDTVTYLVAEMELEAALSVVGFVRVVDVTTPPAALASRRFALVDSLVVHESARRRGIARALLSAAEAWARDRGIAALEVTVWAFNEHARELYEGEGFALMRHYLRKPL